MPQKQNVAVDVGVISEDSLTSYLRKIQTYPYLSVDQEDLLVREWFEENKQESAHQLINSYLRLVVKIANGFRGYGFALHDLVSEGNIGLMEALKRFDPTRGFRLSTYAVWWIKAYIQTYVLHSWSLVKIGTTSAQKKLFFNLNRIKANHMNKGYDNFSPEEIMDIAKDLCVSKEEVENMVMRLSGQDHSLNVPISGSDSSAGEWIDWLVDEDSCHETAYAEQQEWEYRRTALEQALNHLNERERQILVDRKLIEDPKTLEDLAEEHGISRERVRQIELKAMEKIQKIMTKDIHPKSA